MGRDKALVQFAGKPLLAHALALLCEAGLSASIAGSRPELARFAQVIADQAPNRGPLGGICAALASTSSRWAVFLPVDLPGMPASLVAYLLRHARITGRAITLASVNGCAQTFPAVIDRAALPVLQAELEAGRGGCFSSFQAAAAGLRQPLAVLGVELLVQAGQVVHPGGLPPARWFLNLNTPADLRRAEAHSSSLIA
jgi:molybdopterin-guanine dinucleotide biosynthesis protein A